MTTSKTSFDPGSVRLREGVYLRPDGLTQKQYEIYSYICDHFEQYHDFPSHRHLMRKFGWKSPNATIIHLEAMASKGWLDFQLVDGIKRWYIPAANVEVDREWRPK